MRSFLLALAVLVVVPPLVACADPETDGASEEAFTAGDFAEDSVLPYAGTWLDAPKALAGVGQFDRLRTTIHDDAKCSTMVGIAAAIVGGEVRFRKLLDAVEKRREGRREDLATLGRVRQAVDDKKLSPRNLHELTDVMARAYGVIHGAQDEQIAQMVEESGYAAVKVGSRRPEVLVDRLGENEVAPLGIVAEGIPHITLLWKDGRGTVRLYDSDDVKGPHVMPRGTAPYNARLTDPQSSWDLETKYR